jgi:hypothetical protein
MRMVVRHQGGGQFDCSAAPSRAGTLVYLAGKENAPRWPIVWLDSSGKTQPLLTTPGVYTNPRFSPDGRRLALEASDKGSDIFVYDLERESMARLTFDGHSGSPVWSPDGARIAFYSRSAAESALIAGPDCRLTPVKCCGLLKGPRAAGSTFGRHHRPRRSAGATRASRRSKSGGTGCASASITDPFEPVWA